MKKRSGVTLIELMAVIILISILAFMVTPVVKGMIDSSKEEAARANAYALSKQISLLFQEESLGHANQALAFTFDGGTEVPDVPGTKLDYRGVKPLYGSIAIDDVGMVNMLYWDGKFCIKKEASSPQIISFLGDSYLECTTGSGGEDLTAPVVTFGSNSVTTTSITIVANASDEESSIVSYHFSKDGGATWDLGVSNVYTYNNLTYNTSYNIKVKAQNSAELTGESSILGISTATINPPVIVQNPSGWSSSKTITFNFPTRNGDLDYYFSTNGGTSFTLLADQITQDVNITSNGLMVAQIRNGASVVESSSLDVTQVDATLPSIAFVTNGGTSSGSASTIVNASDAGSGINTLEYAWTTTTSTPGSGWASFTSGSTLTQSTSGTYYLHIRATDLAGNIRNTYSNAFIITTPDTTNPVVTITFDGVKTYTITATDAESGLSFLGYIWANPSSPISYNTNDYTSTTSGSSFSANKPKECMHIRALAYDNAGNYVVELGEVYNPSGLVCNL